MCRFARGTWHGFDASTPDEHFKTRFAIAAFISVEGHDSRSTSPAAFVHFTRLHEDISLVRGKAARSRFRDLIQNAIQFRFELLIDHRDRVIPRTRPHVESTANAFVVFPVGWFVVLRRDEFQS